MKNLIDKFKSKSLPLRIGIILLIFIVLNGVIQLINNEIDRSDKETALQEKTNSYNDPRSGEQIAFLETFINLKEEFSNSEGNDLVQDELASKIQNYLSAPRSIQGWIGRVKEIDNRITVDFDNSELATYDGEGFGYNGVIYIDYDNTDFKRNLRPGDYIIFSGQIMNELSFTDRGSVDEPEVLVVANYCKKINIVKKSIDDFENY